MESYEGIIEGGVAKFIGPISLPERTKVLIQPAEPAPEVNDKGGEDLATRRRAAWEKLFAEIEADPDCKGPEDGWDPANHDDILYGGPNGPA
ncbi:hypothetical protein [Botrimarina mediterranea]|uniref:Uncharacterized protein n=1 Tax=Botrimarina mediterranea TaxID=2528022 RepID=A0A518K5C3_9BACT|nr:hypothetical protein [Botrimarina mediterranea]QDV72986.1 hypothetical protein Spa11_11730 [Botrimarina mediterranea]QDV77560.1 hypothetical protein K2D_11560 [Planctomycetes bacterium K2D]